MCVTLPMSPLTFSFSLIFIIKIIIKYIDALVLCGNGFVCVFRKIGKTLFQRIQREFVEI